MISIVEEEDEEPYSEPDSSSNFEEIEEENSLDEDSS
jgi:hypothetical protein